ncbi:hypothetical protein D3C84_1158240 [compost metagenome]
MSQPPNLILAFEMGAHLKIALLPFLHQPGELAQRTADQPHQNVADNQCNYCRREDHRQRYVEQTVG